MVLRERLASISERISGGDSQRQRESAITRNAREDAGGGSEGIASRAVRRLRETASEQDTQDVRRAARRAGAGASQVARRGAQGAGQQVGGVEVDRPRGLGTRKQQIAQRAQDAAMIEAPIRDATLDPAAPDGMDEFAAVGTGRPPEDADASAEGDRGGSLEEFVTGTVPEERPADESGQAEQADAPRDGQRDGEWRWF